MICNELRELEGARRRTLWALASLRPGDPTASELLTILDELDDQERNGASSMYKPLDLDEVRNSVPVHHHQCGIDIVLELNIPQPWRERFRHHRASPKDRIAQYLANLPCCERRHRFVRAIG